MAEALTTIGFDADDTLWQNEHFFHLTQARFAGLLADFTEPDHLMTRLEASERRNLAQYGYGIKGFTLSMIETAIEVTDGAVPSTVIEQILEAGREMLSHPIELLDHVAPTIAALARDYTLVLITKGDLLDQERKLAQSGLGDLFDAVEIVSEKTPQTYRAAFDTHGSGAKEAMMVGNSLKSDVIPALTAGSWAVHVPHDLTWALEHAEPPLSEPRFSSLTHLGELKGLIDSVAG